MILHDKIKLKVLDLGTNRLQHLENVGHLTQLEELWVNNNQLASFEEVDRCLKPLTQLETVYFGERTV